ncbi:carbohydrate ABC transporter permease [Paenibacillus abyssi]|uniref:ABC transporter permease protein YtcP n=1 Tax=Paenibacillus abyssi TaxID=1340531 RepID=A0A917CR31_9BACL|nr:carbohydrate ABC transporter permease [Paenibacillus abyssi]GGF96082.1 putative ABC transporter permease protein YtcP [Paenibacillus abyssi]
MKAKTGVLKTSGRHSRNRLPDQRTGLFEIVNGTLLVLTGILMLIPFLHVLAGSLSSEFAIVSGKVTIFPVDFNLNSYRYILSDLSLWRSFMVTVYITVTGVLFAMICTILMAYPLSKPRLRARGGVLLAVLFVMIFGTPIIPFFLAVRGTGLLDNVHSLVIPSAINAFNLLVLKSFFENVPMELEESAKMDGANDFHILLRIFLSLSKPALATIALFYAVEKWNSYYHALLFISDHSLWPLQVKVRMLFTIEEQAGAFVEGIGYLNRDGIRYATIVFAMVPILFVYPFLQKHFTKGVMLGSIKE